ncbi:MAG: hypothetical protein ACI835_003099 [Planctomycetota bacterium]|jgi:hypothetical protein
MTEVIHEHLVRPPRELTNADADRQTHSVIRRSERTIGTCFSQSHPMQIKRVQEAHRAGV